MDKSRMTEYIKVNFPLTAEDFAAGNGEGMWVLVDPETKAKYDADAAGGHYVGILGNDSVYFPGMNHGEVVHFEMRGDCRPVALFDGFLSERDRLTKEGKELLVFLFHPRFFCLFFVVRVLLRQKLRFQRQYQRQNYHK